MATNEHGRGVATDSSSTDFDSTISAHKTIQLSVSQKDKDTFHISGSIVSQMGEPHKLTMHDALAMLATGQEYFVGEFFKTLRDVPFPAYFFELPLITSESIMSQDFEFVLVNSPYLATYQSNPTSFQEHFTSPSSSLVPSSFASHVVAFPNLSNDAVLVVPRPFESSDSTHLASFMRTADVGMISSVWQTVGNLALAHLEHGHSIHKVPGKLWLSTSGLGVPWLHIRLSSAPKYYTYQPYKA